MLRNSKGYDRGTNRARWIIVGRALLALVFLAGASYNALLTLRAPATELQRLIALSPAPAYRQLASRIATPHATSFVVLIIILEGAVAASTSLPLPLRRIGYALALVFFAVLIPLISWYGLANLVWAIPTFLLLRYDGRVTVDGAN